MNIRNFTRAIFAIACVFLALVAFGCGGNKDAIRLIPNERPRVSLTAAPVNTADTAGVSSRAHGKDKYERQNTTDEPDSEHSGKGPGPEPNNTRRQPRTNQAPENRP